MKLSTTIFALLAVLGITGLQAQTLPTATSQANVPPPTDYQVVQQDANSRVWQRETYDQGPDGQVVTNLHSYSEIASGLNYLDSGGTWQASKEEIDLQPNGTARAVQGQHQAYFPANIFDGEIELITPDHKTLKSQPAALSYDDGTNTVLIAILTNSVGQVINDNQVIYTNAFAGLDADLIYTYTRAGFEQDVVLREQPPTPESLGLNSATTRLQVLTEFFNPPQPCETACALPEQAGLALSDETLDFGTMQMAPGKAFRLGASSPSARVGKSWITLEGRQFLVEAVPVMALTDELESLPVSSAQTITLIKTRMFSRNPMLPPPHLAKARGHQLRLARNATTRQPGVVLDYNTLNTSLTNFTFQGDTTYYLSGAVNLYGTNTFEGGTVIKYATNTSITIESTNLNWEAGAYRPVIFTAKDDNSVGQTVSGSTGSPGNNYANPALSFNMLVTSPVISNFRISYARQALYVGYETYHFYNGQIVNCQNGLTFPGPGEAGGTLLRNILFLNVLTNFDNLANCTIDVQNSTFDSSAFLAMVQASPSNPVNLDFTNCFFYDVAAFTNSNSGTRLSGGNNVFGTNSIYSGPEFGANFTSFTGNNPFNIVGGGGNYLLTNYVFMGTANIDPTLLSMLTNKTVYPPLVYSNVIITNGLTLGFRAPRDTNAAPIIGYHYDPLDYVFGGCDLSTNLTFASGTAVGWFYSNDHLSGIACAMLLNNGANLTFSGTATSPCWMVRFATVQEGNGAWTASSSQPGVELNGSGSGATPQLNAQFSKWSVLGSDAGHFQDNRAFGTVNIANSEFYLENIVTYKMSSIYFTNCLFYRAALFFYDSSAAPVLTMENCTLYNGILVGSRTSGQNQFWTIENTVFDGTGFRFTDYYNGSDTLFNHNAYNTNNLSGLTIPFPYGATTNYLEVIGLNDVKVSTYNWQTSWLGNFYLPSNNPVLERGSTTANLLGLYYFTTQTNQALEADSPVDIGYHYVATDQSGNALATFNDGIPDYLDDPKGNGLPNWWELEYFGNTSETAGELDGAGNTFLYDYQYNLYPNIIEFALLVTNFYVNSSNVPVQVNLLTGTPAYYAVLVNDTNEADAVWEAYPGTNLTARIGSTNGLYNVWIGLKGLATNATASWDTDSLPITLYAFRPVLTITNPVGSTVTQPMLQVQGYANEGLSSLTFDVSNATSVVTNQTGFLTGQFYDTNLLIYTTNYFECYNAALNSGSNLITLHAVDWAGNTTNVSRWLDYIPNTNPPAISLLWPLAGTRISGSNFTVQAQINEPQVAVTATINGTTLPGLVEQNGMAWVQNLLLSAGTNMVTLTASNVFGGVSITNFNVIRNDVGLTINPLTGGELNQSSVTVTGTVGNPGDQVTVNGVAASVDGGGNWEADGVPVNPAGTASLNVQVTDASDNPLASQNTYQPQPPAVVLMSYSGQINFASESVGGGWSGASFSTFSSVVNWLYSTGGNTHFHQTYSGGDPTEPTVFDDDESLAPATNSDDAILIPLEFAKTDYNWSDGDGDMGSGTYQVTTHEMIQPSGQQTAGQTNVYLVLACATEVSDPSRGGTFLNFASIIGGFPSSWYGNLPLPPEWLRIMGQALVNTGLTNTDGSTWGATVLAGKSGQNAESTLSAAQLYGADDYTHPSELVTNLTLQILDANNGNANLSTQTNTVIVGQQMNFTCQLSVTNAFMTNWPLSNFQWTVPGYAISNYVADVISGVLYTNFITNNNSTAFYWADAATNRIVQCSANINGKTVMGQATFNVLKPKVQIAVSTGPIAIDTNFDDGFAFHYGDALFRTNVAGIWFTNLSTMPVGNYNYGNTNYSVEWVQLANSSVRQFQTNNSAGTWYERFCATLTNSVLDSTYPSPTLFANSYIDAPGEPLSNASDSVWKTVIISDNYTTWLMFKPAGGGWVPLQNISWNWGGTATLNATPVNGNYWSLTGSTNGVSTNLNSTVYPTWNDNLLNYTVIIPK